MNSRFFEIELSYKQKDLKLKHDKIVRSEDIYTVFLELFDNRLLTIKEECYVLYINKSNRITGFYKLSSGGITGTIVDIRLIMAIALKSLSLGLILAHSHPSGNLKPSPADFFATDRLRTAAQLMDIRLIDHLIITTNGYYSFSDQGEI